jgi:hypothetical protein
MDTLRVFCRIWRKVPLFGKKSPSKEPQPILQCQTKVLQPHVLPTVLPPFPPQVPQPQVPLQESIGVEVQRAQVCIDESVCVCDAKCVSKFEIEKEKEPEHLTLAFICIILCMVAISCGPVVQLIIAPFIFLGIAVIAYPRIKKLSTNVFKWFKSSN